MRAFFNVFAAMIMSLLMMVPSSMVSAQDSGYQFNLLLLIDSSYSVDEGGHCKIDIDRQSKVLMKIHNQSGKRTGGVWFLAGEPVELAIGSRTQQTYCAYAKTIDVAEPGDMDLSLHDVYLTTIDSESIAGDEMLRLVVGSRGLVDEDVVDYDEVAELDIVLPEKLETSTDSNVARRSRADSLETPAGDDSGEVTRSSRTGTTRTSTTSSRNSSNTTETIQQSGIMTGEWELEGPGAWDMLFVAIDEDPYGYGAEIIDELDPLELAVDLGFPLIGEGRAPDGCRIFAFSGPLSVAMYVAYCVDGEHYFYAGGTDKELIDAAINDFINGRPFRIPWGYTEVY